MWLRVAVVAFHCTVPFYAYSTVYPSILLPTDIRLFIYVFSCEHCACDISVLISGVCLEVDLPEHSGAHSAEFLMLRVLVAVVLVCISHVTSDTEHVFSNEKFSSIPNDFLDMRLELLLGVC